MTFIQAFLMVVFMLSYIFVIGVEVMACMFCVGAVVVAEKWWQKLISLIIFVFFLSLMIWEATHGCWIEQYKHLIGL